MASQDFPAGEAVALGSAAQFAALTAAQELALASARVHELALMAYATDKQ